MTLGGRNAEEQIQRTTDHRDLELYFSKSSLGSGEAVIDVKTKAISRTGGAAKSLYSSSNRQL
jgi:hypothetical protein